MTPASLTLLLFFAEPSGAATASEHQIALFFLEILLMLVLGRALGELLQRLGQPEVMGQLIAGVIIGPSVFGALLPDAYHWVFPNDPVQKRMIDAVSQLGILLLLVLTGIETDLGLVNRMKKAAFFTSLSGIVVPFTCGFILGELLPNELLPDPSRHIVTSLFIATALSISSVKIVAMVIMEVGFLRRNVGQIILASAILDDTIGWIIIAVIGGLASRGTLDLGGAAVSLFGTIAFLVFCLTIGRRGVAFIIRWTNDNLVNEMPVLTAILVLMIGLALVTDLIGVHTVLGAFVVGIMVGQSPILTEHIEKQLRGMIVAFFAPIFFAVAGREIDLTLLTKGSNIALAAGFILIASAGKIGGAFLGGKLSGMTGRQSTALAFGMNARGSTEVIIATIGLSLGVVNQDLFTIIVIMAIVTTLITPPALRWALARIPPTGEEKKRLEREAAAEAEFITSVERILVATDGGSNGNLAAILAGLVAGTRKVMTTVLDAGPDDPDRDLEIHEKAERAIEAGIKNEKSDAAPPAKPPLLRKNAPPKKFAGEVNRELEKGYDILFLGVDGLLDQKPPRKDIDTESLVKTVEEFQGAIGLVISKGRQKPERMLKDLDILVPSTGADYSQRASEIAVALAKAVGGKVTAMHVLPPVAATDLIRRPSEFRTAGRNVLKAIKELGRRHGVTVRTSLKTSNSSQAALLRMIKRGKYDLVVVGAKQRPGEKLYFGRSVAVLSERSEASLLVINS